MKITNNTSQLILDDEYADVHLGRFKDVSHSKNYESPIRLGLTLHGITLPTLPSPKTPSKIVNASCEYVFKSTKRTQEIYLESAVIRIGETEFRLSKGKKTYRLRNMQSSVEIPCRPEKAFKIDIMGTLSQKDFIDKFGHFSPFYFAQEQIVAEFRKILYLGPFRQPPRRLYPTRGATPKEVGSMGEACVALLANESVQSQSRIHINQVSGWLNDLQLAQSVSLSRSGGSDLFSVDLRLQDNTDFPLADLGYGLSQVLPVLTQCSFAPEGATLLFEQPELHLHDIAAKGLAKVFNDTVESKKASVLVETHSPALFKAFLRGMSAREVDRDKFAAYRVHREAQSTRLHLIDIDEECDVEENWERGLSIP
jgi:hypothetical protein